MLMPSMLADNANPTNDCWLNDQAASSIAITADDEASANPAFLPTRFINMAAGIAVIATDTTINDTGKVAYAGLSANSVPIIPPSVTTTIDPVADIS